MKTIGRIELYYTVGGDLIVVGYDTDGRIIFRRKVKTFDLGDTATITFGPEK